MRAPERSISAFLLTAISGEGREDVRQPPGTEAQEASHRFDDRRCCRQFAAVLATRHPRGR
jgi:hypothetical protein